MKDSLMESPKPKVRSVVELEELRNRLREAEETLSAIRNGEVDSLIVSGPNGDQVFSLKGAEQPYRLFVEQMQEGAVTLTRDGAILYANARFAQMVQARLEKVIGSQLQSFIRASEQRELAEILASPGARSTRCVLSAGDGSLIPVQLSFHPLPVEEVEAISLVVTDLTESEEKRELTEALSSLRVAQEQLQLQNDELKAARAVAEAASHAKDNFLAALSHELRTPLTPVLMTVATLEADATLPQSVRRHLHLLHRNVELEARLIDDLLDLTRIVHGKMELHTKLTDVHALVDAAVEISRGDIEANGLQLIRDLRAQNHHVSGDSIRIQQVLWNLIRNAAKFTPQGGRVIVRSDSGADGVLRISITDTGIGIAPGAIAKIFTPFEQADRAVTRQFGGLGLGLAISKRLAEMHGGTITAESEGLNKGATFTLILPTARSVKAEAAPAPAAGSDAAPQTGGVVTGNRLRILLVEDHADTRRSMSRLLSLDHEISEAESVKAALRAASEQKFDLVISDVGLPDGSGLDLMRQLRDKHNLAGICLSGYGMEDDLARSAEAGFYRHLTKPVDFHALEKVIAEMKTP
jgi:PAS domain S-box-containing protein